MSNTNDNPNPALLAFMLAPDPQIITSIMDGSVKLVNDAFCENVGYPREEILGQPTIAMGLWNRPQDRDRFAALLKESGVVNNLETTFRCRGGELIPVLVSARVIPWQGEPSILTVGRYIGEIKSSLARQKKLEEQLRQAQKMEVIGNLAGGIAHDFNNLIYAIMGFAQAGYDSLEPGNQAREDLADIIEAGQRASDLVGQILAFSRKADFAMSGIDLAEVIDRGTRLLRGSLPSTVEISTDVEAGHRVLANQTQLHQVLLNLCTNSAQALDSKRGELRISLKEVAVDDSTPGKPGGSPDGRYVKLTVEDNGSGISPDHLDRVMEPFFTTKAPGVGTGMGLATVGTIVTAHGGFLDIVSAQGEGTTVNVFFPSASTNNPEAERVEPAPTHSTQRGRIMLVDDEDLVLSMLRRTLTSVGHEVIAFNSSVAALEEFHRDKFRFDLAVLDMTMPGLTGLELGKELIRFRQDMPIILMTGYPQPETERRAREAGFRAYLPKPIQGRKLENEIDKILSP